MKSFARLTFKSNNSALLSLLKTGTLVAIIATISACSTLAPELSGEQNLPEKWFAKSELAQMPHAASNSELLNWWSKLGDPILVSWINAAQQQSPTLASARAQILTARANRSKAFGALLPSINLQANASKSSVSGNSPSDTSTWGLQASWEIGLWGESFMAYDAVLANLEATGAQWHQARVLLAAEVAKNYYAWHFCQLQKDISSRDNLSRENTLKNVRITEKVGLTAPANSALAEASNASGKTQYLQIANQCEQLVKSIVAITAIDEDKVRADFHSSQQNFIDNHQQLFTVSSIPSKVISQRPDVQIAQRQWLISSLSVGLARAQLLPSLRFTGSITRLTSQGFNFNDDLNSWSVGPLTLNLPLFNRSALYSASDAAYANYLASGKMYSQTLRNAVKDVEIALINLDNTKERLSSSAIAAHAYGETFKSAETRYKVGLANLLELEDVRRSKLQAESNLASIKLERANAWINLYLALGGGFDSSKDYTEEITAQNSAGK